MDETAPVGERRYYDDYDRRLAAEIVAMLVNTRSDAQRALAVVDIIMNLPLPARRANHASPTLHRAGEG
jgi:hypothetical protein